MNPNAPLLTLLTGFVLGTFYATLFSRLLARRVPARDLMAAMDADHSPAEDSETWIDEVERLLNK